MAQDLCQEFGLPAPTPLASPRPLSSMASLPREGGPSRSASPHPTSGTRWKSAMSRGAATTPAYGGEAGTARRSLVSPKVPQLISSLSFSRK